MKKLIFIPFLFIFLNSFCQKDIDADTSYYTGTLTGVVDLDKEYVYDYDDDFLRYETGLTTALSDSARLRINAFIVMLKDSLEIDSLHQKFDIMYILANETAEASLRNLVQRNHDATNVHSTLFTAWEGYTGDGVSDYLTTNWNPTDDASVFTQNDNSFGVYTRTNVAENSFDLGCLTGGNSIISPRYSTGIFYYTNSGATAASANTDSRGVFVSSRTSSSSVSGYKNGILTEDPTGGETTGLASKDFYILARNNNGVISGPSSRQVAFAFAGKSLTATEVRMVTNCIERYMDINEKGVLMTDAQSKPMPENLAINLDATDSIELSWDALSETPDGYNVYLVFDDAYTKLNEDFVTTTSYKYLPDSAYDYNFTVTGVYELYGNDQETLYSDEENASYFLPNLAKISNDSLIIGDGRFPDQLSARTIITGAVFQRFNESEKNMLWTDTTITEGETIGDWYANGSVIKKKFQTDTLTIDQEFDIGERMITIKNNIEFSDDDSINYVGFHILGNKSFDIFQNIYGVGSGQNIIDTSGIWFHNGTYTYHRVLAGIDIDYGYKLYSNGDIDSCKLYLLDGRDAKPVRVLYQPDGYNSSFTISNHTDNQTIETQRTVMYGTSDTTLLEYGTKGLASRGILSDWSIFPNYPSLGFVGNSSLTYFLIGLKALGNEIIPHATYSTVPDGRDKAVLYLPYYNSLFSSTNWTDHSLGGGAVTNGICSKGWDITDEDNYMLDLFEQYGFNKTWAYSDFTGDRVTTSMWGFNNDIAYYNDHLKLPVSEDYVLIWKSSDRPFYNEWFDVNDLIDNCGSVDSHDYLGVSNRVYTSDTTSFKYTYYNYGDGYKITTGFDNVLNDIATYKTSGEIWNPTNTDWNEYFKELKNIELYLVDANTILINNSGSAIDGFSFIICKTNVTPLNGLTEISNKQARRGTICWLDLPTGETTITY